MGTSKELFVDTQGICFFCLEEMSTSQTEDSACSRDNNERSEMCLRSICCYLNINPREVLLKTLRESVGLQEESKGSLFCTSAGRMPCDFSVMLCNKCTTVGQKLTSLIRELELTQMQLSHNLQSLEVILNTSEQKEEGNRWRNHVQRNMNFATTAGQCHLMDQLEVRLVENFRACTRETCSQKVDDYLKTATPRVHLSRLNTENFKFDRQPDIKLPPTPQWEFYDESETDALNFDDDTSSPTPVDVQEPLTEPIVITPVSTMSIEHAPITRDSRVMQSSKTGNTNKINSVCQFCKQVFLRPGRLEEHVVLYHRDKLFSNKSARLTTEEFNMCCQNLVQTEIAACRQTVLIKDCPITHCSYCNASFSKLQDLEVHLCSRHISTLEERLLDIQEELFPVSSHQQGFPSSSSNVKMEYIIYE